MRTKQQVHYFSNVFDLVDHSLLTNKLKLYTIDTSWFSSYFNKRFQQTHYDGAISDSKVISGLILFLIYVNDLPLSLTSTCADIFADDTTIGTLSHSIDRLVETLTTDLQNVLSWYNSNN